MAAVQLQDILLGLNYLLGDSGIPSSGTANQIYFVNRTIEKIWDLQDFEWNRGTPTNIAITANQTSSLSALTNYDGEELDVREVVSGEGNDRVYKPIQAALVLDSDQSEYYFAVTGNSVDGYSITINQTTNPTLQVTPKYAPDVLTALTDTTRIPRAMPIAEGAFVFMQRTRNPFGTLQEFNNDFARAVADLVRLDTHRKPKRQYYTPSESGNRQIGRPRHG